MKIIPLGPTDVALENHIAVLGKTGSGKSNAAKWMAERLMDRSERFCAIDPTGTWWGMRLKPDGKPSKYKPIIFGGKHADIPILPEHGAAIAEAIATSNDSAIIDLREMSVGGRTKFFAAFAEALLRLNVGKLHLMLDEAHLFAPQGRVNDPQSGIMLNATNNLVSLGRGNGIRIVMVSQRPAKLHKDSLTQVETMIAMRLIAPQDRNAISDWVGEWGDVARGKEIIAALPSMKVGEAYFWSPEQNYLERVSFPLVKTYDTGRPSEDIPHLTTPIDVADVTKRLEVIAAEVVANDPKRLKSRIAELETALGQAKASSGSPDSQLIQDAHDDGFTLGWNAGVKTSRDEGYRQGFWDARQALTSMFGDKVQKVVDEIRGNGGGKVEDIAVPVQEEVSNVNIMNAGRGYTTKPTIIMKGRSIGKTETAITTIDTVIARQAAGMEVSGITGPQAKILTALKVWQALGHQTPTRQMVAPFAGYSPTTKSFKNALSELRTAQRVDYADGGLQLLITWDAMDLKEAFLIFRGQLSGPERSICNALANGERDRTALAELTNYSPTTKSFKNAVSSLHTKTVVGYAGRGGEVYLTDWAMGLMKKFGGF